MAPLIRKIILAASVILRPELAAHVGAMEASTSEEECGAVSLLQTGVKLREEQLQGLVGAKLKTKSSAASSITHRSVYTRAECKPEPTVTAAFQRFDASGTKLNQAFFDRNFEVAGIRAVIKNQSVKLEIDENRFIQPACLEFETMFAEILEDVQLPDMEMLLGCADHAYGEFGVLKGEGTPGRDLMITPRSLLSYHYMTKRQDWGVDDEVERRLEDLWDLGKMAPTTKSVAQDFSNVSTSVAVFRGKANGGAAKWKEGASNLPLRAGDGNLTPRMAAAVLSKRRPDLLDAGFTDVSGMFEPQEKFQGALLREGFFRPQLTDEQQKQFETVLVIDGDTLPDRLPIQLSWGLPVVLVRNTVAQAGPEDRHLPDARDVKDEFWYPELVSWEHYVLATPETLEHVLETLHAQPELRRRIGEKGKAFFDEHLHVERLKCHARQVLTEYAARYQAHNKAEMVEISAAGF